MIPTQSVDFSPVHSPESTMNDVAAPIPSEKSRVIPRTPSTLKAFFVIAACTSAMLINNANAASMAILLPALGTDLNISQANLQWVTSAYSLSSGCLLIFFGRVADLYGRKKVFLAGYAVISVFALGCGFAQNEITIDVLRGIQGIGGAAIIPASLGILATTFPPGKQRSIAFATFAAGAPLGGVFGFVTGSVLTQFTGPSWRSEFYLFAATSLLGITIGILWIDPDTRSTEYNGRVDWIGTFLVTAGLILIIFSLSDSATAPHGWKTSYIIALLIVGFLLLCLFYLWQSYLQRIQTELSRPRSSWAAPPLIQTSIWMRSRGRFTVMQVIALINWASFSCWGYWVLIYYQRYAGLSPVLTMVRLLPTFVVGILCNVVVAALIGRVDVVLFIAVGTLLTGVANMLFAVINPASPYWSFGFPSAILIVFGADFVFAAGTLFVAKVALPQEQSVAGALFQTMTQLGVAVGLSISTIVFNAVLKDQSHQAGVNLDPEGSNAPAHAQLKAYQAAEWTAFGFGIFGAFLSLFLCGIGVVGEKDPQKVGSRDEDNADQIELHTQSD